MFGKKQNFKILLVLLVCLALACGCGKAKEEGAKPKGKNTIDLSKYVVCEAEGYDGYGVLKATLDTQSIMEDYEKKLKFNEDGEKRFGDSGDTPLNVLKNAVTITPEKSTGLSNDDKITFKISLNDYYTQYLKCKLSNPDGSWKVSGLKPVTKVDPFADIVITYEGISPFAKPQIERFEDTDNLSYSDFRVASNHSVKNGDTFTVEYNVDVDYAVKRYGVLYTATSKEYTVSGLPEYVITQDALTKEYIETAKKEAEERILKVTSTYKDNFVLSDLKYAGFIQDISEHATTHDYGAKESGVWIIYSATVSDTQNRFYPIKTYYPIYFKNLVSENGVITGETDGDIRGSFNVPDIADLRGYKNPYSCYQSILKEGTTYGYELFPGDGFEAYATGDGNVTSMDKLTADFKESFDTYATARAEDVIRAYSERFEYENTYSDIEKIGAYYLFAKNPGTDYSENSKYYMLFRAKLGKQQKVLYFPIEGDGVYTTPSGEINFTTFKGTVYQPSATPAKYAYETAEHLYNETVVKKQNNYDIYMSDGVKELFDSIQGTEGGSAN